MRHVTRVGGVPFARDIVVKYRAHGVGRECSACNDLALIVKQPIARQRHVAARENFRRIALLDAGLFDSAGVVILVEIVVPVAAQLRRIEVAQAV
ncbi:hypothetical protein D3C81_1377060 [compost metagenome]